MSLKDVIPEYEPFEASVANELRLQRRRANISLKEMSEKIGLHSNTLAKCERHEFGVGLEIIYGYSKILNIPIFSFLQRNENSNRQNENPVAELTDEEMIKYSELIQSIFNVFTEQGIKLSGRCALEATNLVSKAIIEQR